MTKEQAFHYRKLIEKAVQSVEDEEALTAVILFPKWEIGADYEAGVKVQHNGTLYRCLTTHSAQSDWTPDAAPSLWTKVLTSDDGTILPWEQPDSTNPYMIGDKVTHNEQTWISIVDNNVWEPGVYGWETI